MKKQNSTIDEKVTSLLKGYRVKQVCAVDKSTFIIMGEWITPEDGRLLDPPYPSIVVSITIHLNFVAEVTYEEGLTGFYHASGGYPHGKKRALTTDSAQSILFFNYDPALPNGSEYPNDETFKGANHLNLIGDHFYIVTGFRSVYKRVDVKQWKLISEQPRKLAKKNPIGSINAMDGFSEQDIYMGGGKGDLWHFNGEQWRQLDPPINWNIRFLVCGGDGKVYISGGHGELMVGRDGCWEQLISMNQAAVQRVIYIYSMAWFKNKLYVANGSYVFYFDGKQWIDADYIQNKGNVEKIHANKDVMMVAASHRVTIFSGENEEILYENADWLKAKTIASSLLDIGAGMIEEGNKLIDLLNEEKKK